MKRKVQNVQVGLQATADLFSLILVNEIEKTDA